MVATTLESVSIEHGAASLSEVPPSHMKLWKVTVLSISAMQIGPNLAISGGMQIPYSGLGSWAAFLGAAVLAMIVAKVIARFAIVYGGTASILSFAQHSLPRWAVALTAATLLTGYVVGPAIGVLGVTIYLESLANSFGILHTNLIAMQCCLAAGVAVLIGICAFRGVEFSARISMLLGAICIPLAIWITLSAGRSFGFNVAPEFSTSGMSPMTMSRGVFAAMGFFIGFDCIAALASETASPKKDVPRVLIWTVGFAGATLVAGVLLQAPVLLAQNQALLAGDSPTKILLGANGSEALAVTADLILVLTCISGLIAWLSGAGVVIAAAAHDGFMPRALSQFHVASGVPRRSIVLLTIVSIALPALVFIATGASPLLATLYASNLLVLLWLVPYALICGALIFAPRATDMEWAARIAAAVGLTIIAAIVAAQLLFPLDKVVGTLDLVFGGLIILVATCFFFGRGTGKSSQG